MFYVAADQKLMVVAIRSTAAGPEISAPTPLFEVRVPSGNGYVQQYDVTRDGQRLLVNTLVEDSAESPITVVLNWTAGFKRPRN